MNDMMEELPRVMIVGTIPYNANTSSRAFDAYFHNWGKENLRQVFSNTKTPVKGHCGSLYQITDQRMLKRFLGRKIETGKEFNYDELPVNWKDNNLEVKSRLVERMYQFGSNNTPLTHIARKLLWKKKYWNTEQFRNWLDDFQPECVFLAYSDDFFIPEIALNISERFNIPILSCIGDDYYFNNSFSLSPLYFIYRVMYKKLIRRVMKRTKSAIYIGDKIKDKYNGEFGLHGDTVYLTSELDRRPFKPIDTVHPKFVYCGNIRLGRNKSLADIGNALYSLNPEYKLHVYSTEKSKTYIRVLQKSKGIVFHGAIPYKDVMRVMRESDVSVIVEGFDKKSVNATKYSLSTKAADSIASGTSILVYGSTECGVISYMKATGCAQVCTDKSGLAAAIAVLINNVALQKKQYKKAIEIAEINHDKEKNHRKSEMLFTEMVKKYSERDGDATSHENT